MQTQSNNPRYSDSIYSEHLINQIHANLNLLLQQAKISQNNINIIKAALPPTSHHVESGPSEASQSLTTQLPSSQPSPHVQSDSHLQPQAPSFPVATPPSTLPRESPQFKQARAIWSYHGSATDDLSFDKGDVIVILSEENQDWWRGQILNSQQPGGLFPSNHVEIILPPPQLNAPPRLPYPPNQSVGAYHPSASQVPSQWQQGPGYNQSPQYADFKAPQQAQPPPMQHTHSAPAPVNITVEKPKKNMLQGRFGQALAGGAGFGAGSAVATHVVNAIL